MNNLRSEYRMNLKDKIIVITGGSKGFGESLAKAFIAEKATVILASDDINELKKTGEKIKADYFVTDVTKPENMDKLSEYAAGRYGQIDIWINNAGIQIAPSPMEDVEIGKLRRLFDINFFGYFYGCQTAVKLMKKQGFGTIININSTAGLDGKPGISAYVSSKFAIKGLTESIRKELSDTNIDVYGVFPGGMQTEIYKEKYPEDISEYMLVDDVATKVIANLKSETTEEDFVIKRPSK